MTNKTTTKAKKEYTLEEKLDYAAKSVSENILSFGRTEKGNFVINKIMLDELMRSLKDDDAIVIYEGTRFNQYTGNKKQVLKFNILSK
jgi:hypothetical protein